MVLIITFIGPRKESNKIILNHTRNHRPTSLRWIKSFLYYKMDKKSIVNYLYQAAVISVLAVGYSMLSKKILKMTPPNVQKFDLEDTGKLVAIVAASEMTREYLTRSYKRIENGKYSDVNRRSISECTSVHWQ